MIAVVYVDPYVIDSKGENTFFFCSKKMNSVLLRTKYTKRKKIKKKSV